MNAYTTISLLILPLFAYALHQWQKARREQEGMWGKSRWEHEFTVHQIEQERNKQNEK